MKQEEGFPIESPCRRECRSDRRGCCPTCLRSREERFNWLQYSDSEKRQVLDKCAQRRRQKEKQREKARHAAANRQLPLFPPRQGELFPHGTQPEPTPTPPTNKEPAAHITDHPPVVPHDELHPLTVRFTLKAELPADRFKIK